MIDILISGGPVMFPLGLLSLVALAIVLERLWTLRASRYLDPSAVSMLTQLITQGEFRHASDYCRRHPGPFAELVHTLVESRAAPYDELKGVLEDTGRHQLLGLERGLPALATIVSGAPLLGLLGTVVGMIRIFNVVGSQGTAVTEKLAGGISEALVTTATGLIIAVPALFAHSYLEARALGILTEIEAQLLDLIHLVRHPRSIRSARDRADEEA